MHFTQNAHFRAVTVGFLALNIEGHTETITGALQQLPKGVNSYGDVKPYKRPDRANDPLAALLGKVHDAKFKKQKPCDLSKMIVSNA